jgi:predicted transcriptional regulator
MADTIHRGSKRNFFMVDNGVFDERLNLEPLDKLVYICLLRYADNNSREAYPGQSRIAKDIGITRQRVNIAINTLTEKGLIEKRARFDKRGSQTSNQYIVYDANEVINRVSSEMTGGVIHDDRGCQPGLQGGVIHDDTKNTVLNILSEEEALHSKEENKTDAVMNIRHLKRLITGTGGNNNN